MNYLGTEVRFKSFFSGGFTTMAIMNPPEKKLEKRTFVQRAFFSSKRPAQLKRNEKFVRRPIISPLQ